MNKLHDLTMRQKFAIVIVPLIATILCFDYLQIKHHYLDYHDSRRLNRAINLGIEINHVVHELQKERGVTSGYLSNGGTQFVEELAIQRSHSDSLLSRFYYELESSDYDELHSLHEEDLRDLRVHLDGLGILRKEVDDGSLHADQAIRYYSEMNNVALNTVSSLINETRDKQAAQQVHAIIYFLKAKEYASIERALGTQLFSLESLDPELVGEVTRLVSAQDSYIDAFLTISNQESLDYYDRIMQGQDFDEVHRLRSLFYDGSATLEEGPEYWYRIITGKINSLKRVEEFMLDHMHAYTEGISSKAGQNFWGFLVIDVVLGLISLLLMTYIVTGLIRNMMALESFTRQVSEGDYSQQVTINSRDEIGHYADTFNMMVQEINKSHKELKRERDHAEYLYENIYKQAEVVFENVEQGIFLLDKELKISNLYSKAVERIFDNKVIANENFCNFMRPRIIQRDFEALEMFMKHLFNSDMDEEVVNQLNPVEQVKIFIGTNGVVITKYLRVSFTRIEREGVIQNIMVTISDETESVLLQQHMEESEAQKKKETEYMLSILKVDPGVLRDFLGESRETLKGISEKYEGSSKSDLNELLKYTFQRIHKIKGNAMSIGLELITEKLHDIEESISKYRDKNVTPDNFLALLYEIEEVDKTLCDMTKMLDKVADIYRNFPGGDSTDQSSPSLSDSLKTGLTLISEESGKPAKLEVDGLEAIELPSDYVSPVKDIVVQLMRNSVSHGIESTEDRSAKGKSETGLIKVGFVVEDDQLQVSYRDDGRGLDLSQIRDKAVGYGLLSAAEARELKSAEVIELLFSNGFSTTERADKLSGRGQGLSLVKELIEERGGGYSVKYRKGSYFELRFHLPMSGVKMEKAA